MTFEKVGNMTYINITRWADKKPDDLPFTYLKIKNNKTKTKDELAWTRIINNQGQELDLYRAEAYITEDDIKVKIGENSITIEKESLYSSTTSYFNAQAAGKTSHVTSNTSFYAYMRTIVPKDPDGVIGDGIQFDGVDDYVEVEDSAVFDEMDVLTVSLWAKISPMDSNTKPFISLYQDAQNFLYMGRNELVGTDRVRMWGKLDNVETVGTASSESINESEWTHVVYVLNGTHYKAYLNGQTSNKGNWEC